jgi:hypothetical protein
MKDISNLLEKFKLFGLEEHTIKDKFIDLLEKKYDEKLRRTDLEIKDRRIILRISGPLKTEVILNRTILLEELNTKLEKDILDIN